ncbi:MarR family winged helix-turn-helix transcriptional regulator [Frigidibacter sp. MR17.24]|uniref:MarR family winged helix-turn-helix transcriptional regulator n=1 Tax=Frigidibacter sp. MR17.24 TaxID=3127345 RepID=UPI003012FBA4
MPTPQERLGRRLQHSARAWRRAVNARLAPLDLTEATWLPLLYLHRADRPVRQVDLAEFLSLDRSSVVRLVDTLEQAGLVKRSEDPGDRRAKRLTLLPAAEPIVGMAENAANEVRSQVLEGITAEDIEVVNRVLERILDRLPGITDDPMDRI